MSDRPTYGYGYGPDEQAGEQPGERPAAAPLPGPSPAPGARPSYGLPSAGAPGAEQAPSERPAYGQAPSPQSAYGQQPAYGQQIPHGQQSASGQGPLQPGLPSADAQAAPTCPRHPGQVSYVRCKRCGRPACGQCQRQAPVGMLCVDCERELAAAQAGSQPRNAAGGRMGTQTPIVTYVLIALCALAFGGQMLIGTAFEQPMLFAPIRALAMPWTFITSGFLHGGVMHLLLNMYALWAVGQFLERTLGHWRYAGIFLLSVIAGHVAVLLLASPADPSWITGTLGASGGVFGLFGAMFVTSRRLGGEARQIIVLIVLNIVITFTVPGISWQGHLGGLVMGTAAAFAMFALRPKATPGADRTALARRSALIHAAVLGAGLLLCIALVAVKALTVPTGSLF